MNIDDMTPDELRRALRDTLLELQALRRRLEPRPPFTRVAEAVLDGMTTAELELALGLGQALRSGGA